MKTALSIAAITLGFTCDANATVVFAPGPEIGSGFIGFAVVSLGLAVIFGVDRLRRKRAQAAKA